jgi:TonB family protein
VFHATLIGIFLILKASPETRGNHRVSVLVPMTNTFVSSPDNKTTNQKDSFAFPSVKKNQSSFAATKQIQPVDSYISPSFKTRFNPIYPEQLVKENCQGEVVLSTEIDKKGNIVNINIVRSDHPLFTQAAIDALKKSTFNPALNNGNPMDTSPKEIVYRFSIQRSVSSLF